MSRDGQGYEINRRMVLASVTVGNGLSSLRSMCADLNMPNPMAQYTFEDHLSAVKLATEAAAEQTMDLAASELRNALDVQDDDVAECRAMFDGTRCKRGHSSLQWLLQEAARL